jgi:hypothetical protein
MLKSYEYYLDPSLSYCWTAANVTLFNWLKIDDFARREEGQSGMDIWF